MIINNDSLHALKELDADSIDAVITDPPYGYSFMGKDWDKAVPSVDIWRECLRVLKPGAFCMVMSAPRSDVQNAMISRLMEAGFRLDFTPIYWTYASGFPKAGNVGKLVDKRHGAPDQAGGFSRAGDYGGRNLVDKPVAFKDYKSPELISDQAKALDGSYTGFQPKPAVEVIIVAMKPLSEKTYVDQALKNGKGITWLDDCRVPVDTDDKNHRDPLNSKSYGSTFGSKTPIASDSIQRLATGRFPANLLVSDDVLNDGRIQKSGTAVRRNSGGKNIHSEQVKPAMADMGHNDSGSYSRYFNLDKWASTLPFLIVPKASKSEKNKGLEQLEDKESVSNSIGFDETKRNRQPRNAVAKNHHPTVKPLKLMSYLITLTTRPGDTVLDPFVGSGTTVVAAKQLDRIGIGIERETEYAEIAKARVEATNAEPEEPKVEQMSLV